MDSSIDNNMMIFNDTDGLKDIQRKAHKIKTSDQCRVAVETARIKILRVLVGYILGGEDIKTNL